MQLPGYQIERELGQGGMAIVYLAVQESLHRHVALKVIKPALTTDEEFAQRFLREGRIIAQLSDPHIVTVYDIACHEGVYYLSMEYLPGGTLQRRIRAGLSLRDSLTVARSIASALHYAHQRSIIHRDIKPQNILFRENGSAVLTDFGIAKTLGSSTLMTRTGLSLGTPRYMSPEQIRGQQVDARADLYSFGVLFYEMLTGNAPYTAEDSFALAMMHVTAPVPELPPPLDRYQPLLNRLMDKEPSRRFQNGEDFIAALDALEAGRYHLLATLTNPRRAIADAPPPTRRFGWKIGMLAAALTGATLAGGYFFLYRPELPAPPPIAATPAIPAVVDDSLRRQTDADRLLGQARQHQQSGALAASLDAIDQGLRLMPAHPTLLALREEVNRQLADLRRPIDPEFQDSGEQRLAHQQAEAEEQRKAEQARQQAEAEQRRVKAEEFLARALDHQRNRAYETSLLHIEQGLQQIPHHQRLLALRGEVRKQLREAQAPPPPAPSTPAPATDDRARITALLKECDAHLRANRLTMGRGGNAADCYDEVLKRDRGNAEALAGLDRIADRYVELIAAALRRGDAKAAKSSLERLAGLNPNHARLPDLRERLVPAETPTRPTSTSPPPVAVPRPPEPAAPRPVAPPPIDLVSVPRPAAEEAPEPAPIPPVTLEDATDKPVIRFPEPEPVAVLEPVATPAPAPSRSEPRTVARAVRAPGCLSGHCQNGQGVYHFPDGSEYSGEFRDAKLHGQGTYVYAGRGEKYVGEWRNGVINGRGVYHYRSGNRYEGEWRNGRKSGQGTYYYADRGDRYVGAFANDQPNGQGTYYYSNGDRYEGEWTNGRKHGQGVLYESGRTIVGEWRNDLRVQVRVEQPSAERR